MYPAAPDTCGQAIDVPEIILNCNFLRSSREKETGDIGDQLARMFTPGAIKSGYNIKHKKKFTQRMLPHIDTFNSFSHRKSTFRTSGVTKFGPLDEKMTTSGAELSSNSSLLNMVAVGALQFVSTKKHSTLDRCNSLNY